MAKGRIMLVDDEENVLNALTRCLRREDYELWSFPGPPEALKYLEDNQVDVIVSDHRMPGMTGLEFLIKARKLYPEVVRILLTGHADMDVAIRAVNEGKLYRFLTKPWNDEELKVTLVNAIELKQLLDRNRALLAKIKKQEDCIKTLRRKHPDIDRVKRDRTGAIIIDESDA
jgi:DNA-binding NtrC family response regulator